MIHDGLWDPYGDKHMGNCAETCVAKYEFTREEQDEFSRESYERAQEAVKSGKFKEEIAVVEIEGKKGKSVVVDDEEPFAAPLDKMGTLKPAFKKDGTVTAANSSKISDGAAALVVTSAEWAEKNGMKPIARIVAHATMSQEPEWFTTAPGGAIKKVLERAGLKIGDIDLFEVNEAFAAVALATMKDAEHPARQAQRQRRRGRPRPSDRLERRAHPRHAPARARGARSQAGPGRHLQRRRRSDVDDRGDV